jgi:predicted NACHT family NTPase
LCEFTLEQIRAYAIRWSKAVALAEGALPEEAEEASVQAAVTLVDRTERNPYVQRLATNPLMLSTLCLVQRYEGDTLPNRRVVLYQLCVEGLLFHRDNRRGLPPVVLGILPLERKVLTFREVWQEVGESTEVPPILAKIRDRSGLLVERRAGIYGFSHLTFQEYLAACAIH